MTVYVIALAGAVVIAALAYKIGQLRERLRYEQSKTESLSTAHKAAEEGFVEAQRKLADIYAYKRGDSAKAYATRFESLISALSKRGKVVILIDEYDKPILNNVTNPEADAILGVLKGFYSTIKTCEDLERFVFITGVTKFCHVSLFSDLNNLTDITMRSDYATMFRSDR